MLLTGVGVWGGGRGDGGAGLGHMLPGGMSTGTTFLWSWWRWAGNQGPGPGLLTCRVTSDKSIKLSGPQCESPLVSGEGVTECPPGPSGRLASPGAGRSRPGASVLLLLLAKVLLVTKPARLTRPSQMDGHRAPAPPAQEAGAQEECPPAGRVTLPRKRTPSAFTIAIRKGLLNTII